MGGQPRSAETLAHNIDYPPDWTDLLFWQTDQDSDLVPNTQYVIKSWVQDADNSMRLVLDTAADAFKIIVTQGQVDSTIVSVPAGSYTEKMLFKFAVSNGPSDLTLHVFSAEPDKAGQGPRVNMDFTSVHIGSDPGGSGHAHGLYALAIAFDEELDADEIGRQITIALGGQPVGPEPGPGDFDGDGRVDLFDFVTFAGCFGGAVVPARAGCSISDLDGDGDVDLVDFGTFANRFGT